VNQFALSDALRGILHGWAKRDRERMERAEAALRVARLLDASGNPLAPWGPRKGQTITIKVPERYATAAKPEAAT
jgi:hypothetical protein